MERFPSAPSPVDLEILEGAHRANLLRERRFSRRRGVQATAQQIDEADKVHDTQTLIFIWRGTEVLFSDRQNAGGPA